MPGLRRRRSRLLFAGALIVVVAVAVVLLSRDDGPAAGPLGSDEAEGLSNTYRVATNFTFGRPVAFNRGDEPAVLDSISLVEPTPGLQVIATRAAGPRRRLLYQASDFRWPTPLVTDQHPVRGHRVPPQGEPAGKRGVELVFGLRAEAPGRYTTRAVRVSYHVGDTDYRATLDFALRVCLVRKGVRIEGRDCPIPRPATNP